MFKSAGAELIAAERVRQVDIEGYGPEHDREHNRSSALMPPGDLVRAAIAYADTRLRTRHKATPPADWPWAAKAWKPQNRARDLIRAGALIAAEIDRIPSVAAPPISDRRRAELIIIESATAYFDDPAAECETLIDALAAPLAQLRADR